jgi:16S rRNA (cytidine1402-2'-O)-methyltransferase
LTKKFEEILRGTVESVLADIQKKQPRGEYVVVVEGAFNKVDASHDES